MTEGQEIALALMFVIGLLGLAVYIDKASRSSKLLARLALAWTVFFCSPALVLLWIKGVFG